MDALFQRNKKALSKATTLDSDTSVFEGELPRKYLFFYQLNIGPFVGIGLILVNFLAILSIE